MTLEPIPPAADLRRVYPLGRHPKLPRTRESVAIHEAGHALVARVLGLPCHAIRIAGEGADAVGGFAMSPAANLDAIDQAEIHTPRAPCYHQALVSALACARQITQHQAALDLATMAAAGRQAEILLAGLPWPGALWSEDHDGHNTRAYLATVHQPPMGLGYVQHRARALLTHHWEDVRQIATRVVETGAWGPDRV